MSALSALFEQFLRERRFLKNVTPKTVTAYQTPFDSLTRTVSISEPVHLTKAVLQDYVVRLRERGLSPLVRASACAVPMAAAEGAEAVAIRLAFYDSQPS